MIAPSIRLEGPSVFNILIQPYAEAGKHFTKAIFPPQGTSLIGRAGHVVGGLLLAIPLINSIVMSIIFIAGSRREALGPVLRQLRNECPETNDAQALIDYFCPQSLFPQQPSLDYLLSGQVKSSRAEGQVNPKTTYLQMLLCEALCEKGNLPAEQTTELCVAFFNLGQWNWNQDPGAPRESWIQHAERLGINPENNFYKAIQEINQHAWYHAEEKRYFYEPRRIA